jgi:PAS domain S-box/DNA binding domain, excisionase family
MGEYLTVRDIAQRLEVTVETVRRWLRLGKLKGTSLGHTGYRITEQDFYAFIHKYAIQADQTLNTSLNDNLAALVENSADFVSMTTLDGIITYINPAGRDLIGLRAAEEAHKRPLTDFLPEKIHYYFTHVIQAYIQDHARWEGDLQLKQQASDALIDVHLTFFLIRHAQTGQPICMAVLARDIREQKELEQRKDTFISMASHELRNPLTAIHANLQLAEHRIKRGCNAALHTTQSAESERPTADIQALIENALRQTKVMNRLIGDLLDGTRIQTNKLNLSLAEHDLVAILQDTVQAQREVTRQRSILLDLPSTKPILVLVDKDRIGQVISNYLTNALKYSQVGEEVVVGLQELEQEIRVWVRDYGPGLTPEQQERVWDRYYQVKDIVVQNGTEPGLGLGLYICKTLITRQGGKVGVDSVPGKGSTFWFTLPLAESLLQYLQADRKTDEN